MKQSGTSSWLLDADRMRRTLLLLCSIALHAGIVMAWPSEPQKPHTVTMGALSAPVNLSFISAAKPEPEPPPPEPKVVPKPKVVKPEIQQKPKIVEKASVKVAKKVEIKPIVKPKPKPLPEPKPKVIETKVKPRPPQVQAVASAVVKAKSQGLSEIPVVTNPSFRRPPKPADYPRQAQRRNQEGTVLVEALVDEKGDVISIKIVKSSGYQLLDRSATKAVRSWAFQPRMVGRLATKSKVQVPVLFELRG